MKKERIFYLDFIRAFATIVIILTHFNAMYLYLPVPTPEKAVITTTVANIYIGDFGVTLFFIISGAALMYVYDNECKLKSFYKKRFITIYPMFWIGYTLAFLYRFYINRGMDTSQPKWKLIFSFLGFDQYLAEVGTFAIIGEWFLGCIILVYIIFPLLRKMVNDHPIILAIILSVIYVYFILFNPIDFLLSKNVLVRLPEVAFGMYFIKYFKKVNLPVATVSLIILIVNTIVKPEINNSVQTTYVGFSSFCVLVYLSKYLEVNAIKKICAIISKYSYAIFLVHHVIILELAKNFDLQNITRTNSYLLFMVCAIFIAIGAYLLFEIHEKTMSFLKTMFFEKDRSKI